MPGNLEVTRGTFKEEDVINSRIASAEEVTKEEEVTMSAKQILSPHNAALVATTIKNDLPSVHMRKPRVTESVVTSNCNGES